MVFNPHHLVAIWHGALCMLAAFEQNIISPVSLAIFGKPACFAVQVAEFSLSFEPKVCPAVFDWPDQYALNCFDYIARTPSGQEHAIAVLHQEKFITVNSGLMTIDARSSSLTPALTPTVNPATWTVASKFRASALATPPPRFPAPFSPLWHAAVPFYVADTNAKRRRSRASTSPLTIMGYIIMFVVVFWFLFEGLRHVHHKRLLKRNGTTKINNDKRFASVLGSAIFLNFSLLRLSSIVQRTRAENTRLQSVISDSTARNTKLDDENACLQTVISDKNIHVNRLLHSIASLALVKLGLNARITSLEKENDVLHSKVIDLQKENVRLGLLEKENGALHSTITDLQDEIACLCNEIAQKNARPRDVTVFVTDDPSRTEKWLRSSVNSKPSDFAKGSYAKMNKLRAKLAKNSANSLQIESGTGHRRPELQHRRRNSVCFGERKAITDKLPFALDFWQSPYQRRQDLVGKFKFSAAKRLDIIDNILRTPDWRTIETGLIGNSLSMKDEYLLAPKEARSAFFDRFFDQRSEASATDGFPGLKIFDVLAISSPVNPIPADAADGSWGASGSFDVSRPLWSRPEVRVASWHVRMSNARMNNAAVNGTPPRVLLNDPRNLKGSKGKTAEAARTRKTLLDPNSLNVDSALKLPREFYLGNSESPVKAAEWRDRV